MVRLLVAVVLLLGASGGSVVAHAAEAAPRVGPPRGTLFIVGGGAMGGLWAEFLRLAGGKDAVIVVIPTANTEVVDDDKASVALRRLGATRVVQLHTRDRAVADTEEFTAPLRAAAAVWITGGRQWRLTDAYLGTRTERELHALLARGGVIGGSSAGATIQGSYLVRGARGDNTIMMAPGYEQGFGFLRDSAIDQHVNTRGRAEDLRPVLRRHPHLLGIAIDEATALVVTADTGVVRGAGVTRFLTAADAPAIELRAGGRFDLAARACVAADAK